MSLSAGRSTPIKDGVFFELPVKANAIHFPGGIVCLDTTNYAIAGAAARKLRVMGRCEEFADNTGGADGDINVKVRKGLCRFANSGGGDLITLSDVLHPCYLVDDQTVAKTDNHGARSAAGIIMDVDADGVWFLMGVGVSELNDKVYLTVACTNLVGATATIYGVQAPCNGDVTDIRSVLGGHVLATGDSTLTGKINGVGITTGVITITQAGSAIGDKDDAQPTALNAVIKGDLISLTAGGAQDNAAAFALVLIEITRR